jgi:hypothetical protein
MLKNRNINFTVSMLPLDSINDSNHVDEIDNRKVFNLHRKIAYLPFFKSHLTVEELMKWDPSPLTESLCLSAKMEKHRVKLIDSIIRHTVFKEKVSVSYERINELLHIGLFERKGLMRDEVYLQLMRTINGLTDDKSTERAWRLMICITQAFPPSKLLSPFILRWYNQIDCINNEIVRLALKRCHCNFNVYRISGPRGYSTTLDDVKYWFDEAYGKVPLFGNELAEIYTNSDLLTEINGVMLPKIVVRLTEMIRALNGFSKEGVFRVSGDLQLVFKLKLMLSKNPDNIEYDSFKDAAVPCSTLKFWMRVLRSPLIPDYIYPRILVARNDPEKLSILIEEVLPRSNYAVVSFICRFILEIAKPEHEKLTKMTLDNFSMVFAPCFMRCPLSASTLEVLRMSGEERQAMKAIFQHFSQ